MHDSSFISFVRHSGKNFSWKKSFLVISEILRPFVNTLTPDEKYFSVIGRTYRGIFN